MRKFFSILAVTFFCGSLMLTGCSKEDADTAGDAIDNAADKVEGAVDDAKDKIDSATTKKK